MKHLLFVIVGLFILLFLFGSCDGRRSGEAWETKADEAPPVPIMIASYAENPRQAENSLIFVDGFREFAGTMREAPIRIYLSDRLPDMPGIRDALRDRGVEVRPFHPPEETRGFILAGKPAAAALAETGAEGEAEILAFLDTNVLMFREPEAFRLEREVDLGYRPVFHRNVGSLYDEPPDPYWSRIYALLRVDPSLLFPMEAAADKSVLRPYYNAGYLVVRPERGLLRKWAANFTACARDEELVGICGDELHNLFLHQAALSATIPSHLAGERTIRFPDTYNYPLFFEKFYPSQVAFDSLEGVVSIKTEFRFSDLPEGWEDELEAPAGVIDWIRAHNSDKNQEGGASSR